MKGQYTGQLIGHRTYEKDGATKHIYEVFVPGDKDSATGLYCTDCSIIRIWSDNALSNPKPNMPVVFYGELMQGRNGQSMRYTDLAPAAK